MNALLFSLLLATTAAATSPQCSTPEHRQFDFWAGEWVVRTADGRVAGNNRITLISNGCALLEEWTGSRGMVGKSLNMYDAARRVWHQTWVDNNGTLLLLEGTFRDGVMSMQSTSDRITWTKLDGGGIRQLWEKTADGGKTWKVVFDGRYSRP